MARKQDSVAKLKSKIDKHDVGVCMNIMISLGVCVSLSLTVLWGTDLIWWQHRFHTISRAYQDVATFQDWISYFMLHVFSPFHSAYGCADLVVNRNTLFRRLTDGAAELSCASSSDTWRLKCEPNLQWSGNVVNCTEGRSLVFDEYLFCRPRFVTLVEQYTCRPDI